MLLVCEHRPYKLAIILLLVKMETFWELRRDIFVLIGRRPDPYPSTDRAGLLGIVGWGGGA